MNEENIMNEQASANLEAIKNIFNAPMSVKTEQAGNITRDYMDVTLEVKNEDGEKVVVTRKLRNALAVSAMSIIEVLSKVNRASLKMIVGAMSKITDEHAQSVDKSLKTAKALIKTMFPEYSDNTISKYRRIGKLFFEDTEDAGNFHYCSFIDEDVPISNLDVVLTLFDGIDVEKASKEELAQAVSDFYAKYIVTDMIHLNASQKVLKKEVHYILNPVIDAEAKEVDTDTPETPKKEELAKQAKEAEEAGEVEVTPEMERAEAIADFTLTLNAMSVMLKGNKQAEKAIKVLIDELAKM